MKKISIVTSTLNSYDGLVKTGNSIREQSTEELEWVVIDGCSTDSTQEFLRNNELISYWISEKDSGIYEAWNKAIEHVTGNWIIFIGAGDIFTSNKTIVNLLDFIDSADLKNIKFIYSDIIYANNIDKICKKIKYDSSKWDLGLPMLPPHPCTLHFKDLFLQNEFDESYKIAADSKFLLQNISESNTIKYHEPITIMEIGGISSMPKNWKLISLEKSRIIDDLNITKPPLISRLQDIKLFLKPILFWLLSENYLNKIIKIMI